MKRILLLVTVFALSFPALALAAGVGFVPSTGIWFSRSSFSPNETIRVYSVVINNDYYLLNGTVAFFDNDKALDAVDIQNLQKETAKQIRVFWAPSVGEHVLSARFTKAVAIDEKGKQTIIDLTTINGTAGAPLKVGNGEVVPISTQTTGAEAAEAAATLGAVKVEVAKEGDKLTLAAPRIAQVEGVKIASTQSSASSSAAAGASAQTTSSDDPFAKNREALEKAAQVMTTITSSVSAASKAYGQGKTAWEKSKEYYEKAKEWSVGFAPYVDKVKPYWLKISDNNDPKRIAIGAGGLVVLVGLIRWWLRRRRWHRYRRGDY